jgi:hypothetical protein
VEPTEKAPEIMATAKSNSPLRTIWLICPILAAVIWSAHPSALAAWALIDAPPFVSKFTDDQDPQTSRHNLRRQIQRHFLRHYIYIPLDDIVTINPDPIPADDTVSLVMQKACGRGRLFVWIPFKIRLPIIGEKVFEWCWKPQTKGS